LFLNTLREIIIHNPSCLLAYLTKLTPLLLSHGNHAEESIRHIAAECLGRLFVHESNAIMEDLRKGLNSTDPKVRSTITRSFKFAGVKETDRMSLEIMMDDLISKISDSDLSVKRNALESLINIVHNHPESFR